MTANINIVQHGQFSVQISEGTGILVFVPGVSAGNVRGIGVSLG
jgi:hypothetical protein